MTRQPTFWGDVTDERGPYPEQYARALRDLLYAWQMAVLTDPEATPAYRARMKEVVGDAYASLDDGASAYEVAVFTLAPVFAAHDDETVSAIVLPDDEDEAATVRRAVQAGAAAISDRRTLDFEVPK